MYRLNVRVLGIAIGVSASLFGHIATADDGTWEAIDSILPVESGDYQNFGLTVRLDGDTAAIALGGDFSAPDPVASAVDVFVRNRHGTDDVADDTWDRQAHFVGPPHPAPTLPPYPGGTAFGYVLGLSGDTLLVGAPWEYINFWEPCLETGAAYIYRRTGGSWGLVKRVQSPDACSADGDREPRFAVSGAIDGDLIAVAGFTFLSGWEFERNVWLYNLNGDPIAVLRLPQQPGVFYDADAGRARTPWQGDICVDVSGDSIVVGGYRNPETGVWGKPIYVYRRPHWGSPQRLPSPSPSAGIAVAVSGDHLLVGAPYEATSNGGGAVYTYAYDGTRWVPTEQQKLVGPPGSVQFGRYLSMSGHRAVTQNSWPDAWVYHCTDPSHTPTDPTDDVWSLEATTSGLPPVWSYTAGSDISGETMMLGRRTANNSKGTSAGQVDVYHFGCHDEDRDGLCDHWETDGIDGDGDGDIDLDLPAMGADPRHKTLFVEVDAMYQPDLRQPCDEMRSKVATAFFEVTNDLLQNPDGQQGIDLIIHLDEFNIPGAVWPSNPFDAFDAIKKNQEASDLGGFGTPIERASENWPAIRKAKEKAFRYCIFADIWQRAPGNRPAGAARDTPAADFFVSLGDWGVPESEGGGRGGSLMQQAGVFMHELGHTLGLQHGGGQGEWYNDDRYNYKPNYYSIMNYTWTFKHSLYPEGWKLRYSEVPLNTLDESILDESAGIGGDPAYKVPIGPPGLILPPPGRRIVPMGGAVDWNGDGDSNGVAFDMDINRIHAGLDASPGDILEGYADWPNLQYPIPQGDNPAFGPLLEAEKKLTYDLYLEYNPPELTDCNSNGVIDDQDVAAGTSLDCNSNGRPDECLDWEHDCNDNGVPDECDIAAGTSQDRDGSLVPDECIHLELDCNTNGVPDGIELLEGAGIDCNSNGVLDVCIHWETDCNENAVPDACDLAAGTSPDCNTNGVPDECDIASGGTPDCNTNGIPDLCDLAAGTSADCNSNGRPDTCDVAARDCNANGIPDDCDFFAGDSTDCDLNWIPDDCELAGQDCNSNGLIDGCEVAAGTSPDCNDNNTPDICDLPDNDCNTNGLIDECEVAAGTSPDCNGNSVPDVCDLPDNDCNTNGVPDDCDLAAGALSQWASYVIDFSSQYSTSSYSASQVLGVPNVFEYGDSSNAWCPSSENGTLEFLTLGFDVPVMAGGVTVRENLGNGFVYQVDVLDEADVLHTVWTGADPSAPGAVVDFRVNWLPTAFLVKGVKIYIDTNHDLAGWEEIDAVQLHKAASQVDCNANGVLDECEPAEDCNSNGVQDFCDLALGTSQDCQSNGILDDCDIGGGTSDDCNSNIIPDECESPADCNSNGIQDICDLAGATSDDCNSNVVPDECEPSEDCNTNGVQDICDAAGGTSPDCNANEVPDECETECNANLVPDECDISGGTSADCNTNAVPDECDVADGSSPDCNTNGTPDECDVAVAALDQWASSVIDFSSEWSPGDYSAAQTLGEPDVFIYGDSPLAWVASVQNGTLEYLTLGFDQPVYATGVTVRESWGNGFVYQVDVLDQTDVLHTVWSGTDPSETGLVIDFLATWPATSFLVKGAKVHIDTDHNLTAWEEVDAVQLHGLAQASPDINSNGIPDECERPGDCDGDGDVDLDDFAELAACLEGPGGGLAQPSCNCFDLDANGDVDVFDFAEFQALFTG